MRHFRGLKLSVVRGGIIVLFGVFGWGRCFSNGRVTYSRIALCVCSALSTFWIVIISFKFNITVPLFIDIFKHNNYFREIVYKNYFLLIVIMNYLI